MLTQKEKEYYRNKIIQFLKENNINYREKLYSIEVKARLKSISAWENVTLVFSINKKELEIDMRDNYVRIKYNNQDIVIGKILIRFNKGNIEIYV